VPRPRVHRRGNAPACCTSARSRTGLGAGNVTPSLTCRVTADTGQVCQSQTLNVRRSTVLADLGESPQAFALAPDGSVVLVTSEKIHRIKSPGMIETIRSAKYGLLYPNSVAVLRSGAIYVGMRHFVTRLRPKVSSFEEDWLVPSDCLRFVDLGYRCVCGGMPKELLIERLTVAEAEARLKPFSELTTKGWESLGRQMQPGDELWTWGHVLRTGGIALVRNGEVVASMYAWVN
jgi:hypothetical protein